MSSVVDLPELDPSVRAIVPFLEAHPEYSFCAHCLARELHGDPRVVREAMWVLDTDPRFRIRTAQCVSCLLTKRVVRFIEPNTETTAPRRVIEMLAQSADTAFCASCVAFSTDLALAEVRRVMSDLETVDEFMRREAACAACGRWQPVIGLRPASEASPARLEELGDLLDGSLRYRKLEIDLLSFRTANGWRPFALVKTPAGAIVPRAPAVLLAIVASKLDADELAAVHAREWIDKHLP